MKIQFLGLIISLLMSIGAMASPASNVLAGFIGAQSLVCRMSKGDPNRFDLRVVKGNIFVRAQNNREGRYYVYGAKVSGSNLVIALQNSVDGPLAQDVLILNLNVLTQLAHHEVTVIQGFDAYREEYDGTRSSWKIFCHLE